MKSGTGDVAENGAYTNKVVISYAGMAPVEDPQYVVIVSAGVPWAAVSGQIATTFHDVMSQVLTMFRVQPSTGVANELPIDW